jgi:hypothetical protein
MSELGKGCWDGRNLHSPSGLKLSSAEWQALGDAIAERAMPLAYGGPWPPETWRDNGKGAMLIWYDAGEMRYEPVAGFQSFG